MPDVVISLQGQRETLNKLNSLAQLQALKPFVRAAGLHVKSKVAEYPPSSEANAPGPYPAKWYERGYGPKWALKGGGIHGRKTSQTLGRRWSIEMRDAGLTAAIVNHVAYGPYVQDRTTQRWFHKARGWKTIQDAVEECEKLITTWLLVAVNRIVATK